MRLSWDDTDGWNIAEELSIGITGDVVVPIGIVTLLKDTDLSGLPVTPRYTPGAERVYYIVVVTARRTGWSPPYDYTDHKIKVIRATASSQTVLYDIPLPSIFVGTYSPHSFLPMGSACFITFTSPPTLWVNFVALQRYEVSYPYRIILEAIGATWAFSLGSTPTYNYITWNPGYLTRIEYTGGHYYKIVDLPQPMMVTPTNRGVLLADGGSKSLQWYFLTFNPSTGGILRQAVDPPSSGVAYVFFTPPGMLHGFGSEGDRVVCLSPYGRRYLEWDDDTTRLVETDLGPYPSLGEIKYSLCGSRHKFLLASLYAGTSYFTGVRAYQPLVYLRVIDKDSKHYYEQGGLSTTISFAEGDVVCATMSSDGLHGIICFSTYLSQVRNPQRVTTALIDYINGTYRSNPFALQYNSSSPYYPFLLQGAVIGKLLLSEYPPYTLVGQPMVVPDLPFFVPFYIGGDVVLLTRARNTLPLVSDIAFDPIDTENFYIRFPMPVTGSRVVSFAIENPPTGSFPYTYFGSQYIISDSIEAKNWEMRVDATTWQTFNGAVRRPTANDPPYEIRVRVQAKYGRFFRVLVRTW